MQALKTGRIVLWKGKTKDLDYVNKLFREPDQKSSFLSPNEASKQTSGKFVILPLNPLRNGFSSSDEK